MRYKRILAFVLAAVVAVLLAVPAKRGAARTTLNVGLYCISVGHQRLECHFDVSGGTAPYTYQFTPQPIFFDEDSGTAIVPCARAYRYQTVYLTVTDSSGATASTSAVRYCGDAE